MGLKTPSATGWEAVADMQSVTCTTGGQLQAVREIVAVCAGDDWCGVRRRACSPFGVPVVPDV